MITEIILIIFAIAYYLFSTFMLATLIQDINKKYTSLQLLGMILLTLLVAPIVTPIVLGIELGVDIREKQI